MNREGCHLTEGRLEGSIHEALLLFTHASKQKHTQHNHECNMTIVNDLNQMTPLCCVFTLLSLQ